MLAANIDRLLFSPIVITLRPGGALAPELEANGVPLYCLGRCSAPQVLRRLLLVLRAAQVRILYSFLLPTNVYALTARMVMPRLKVVLGTRNSVANPAAWEGLRWQKLRVEALLTVIAALRSLVAVEIANSRAGTALAGRGHNGRVQTIPNGIDVIRWKPDPSARARLCREHAIDSRKRIVVTVANCSPYKDYPTLIHAAAQVTTRYTDVVFVAFGNDSTDTGHAARQLVSDLGLESRFIFAGARSDLDGFLAGADVFCLASATEGFSNAICEAMACGLPPVVTDVGDSAFIVGAAGLTVPARNPSRLAEALCQLLDKAEEERRQLGAKARERIVRLFSVEKMVERYQSVFQSLMSDADESCAGVVNDPSAPDDVPAR